MKEFTYEQLLYKAAAYCTTCERCVQEIENKLRLWGAESKDIEQIVLYLHKENYLNEERYCHAFVHDKFYYNKWGRIKICMALRQKGVEEHCIKTALDSIDETEYLKTLQQLLQNKMRSLKKETAYEKNIKAVRFAASHGFEMNIILKITHADGELI